MSEFMDSRNALHHAAQVASALAATYLDGDDPHVDANLGWDLRMGAWTGHPVHGVRAGLRPSDGSWILVRGDTVVSTRPCAGSTTAGALAWLAQVAPAYGHDGMDDRALRPVGYGLPDHPVDHGTAFTEISGLHRAQVERWTSATATALEAVRRSNPGASSVRCWPHHFDLATLLPLDPEGSDAESARSIGVGMTPGDAGIGEIYLYVTPWPYPQARRGPSLPAGGTWHTEGWFGATLRASAASGSTEAVIEFYDAAIAACRDML